MSLIHFNTTFSMIAKLCMFIENQLCQFITKFLEASYFHLLVISASSQDAFAFTITIYFLHYEWTFINIITLHQRSGEGNVFSCMCLSVGVFVGRGHFHHTGPQPQPPCSHYVARTYGKAGCWHSTETPSWSLSLKKF